MRVLIVEDGYEYVDTLSRFLPEITWVRAGDGREAVACWRAGAFDAVFLDMRFHRVAEGRLVGDVVATSEQFNGDLVQARTYLEDHQGTFVLRALRDDGCALPALICHDFSDEPRRWARLVEWYRPVAFLADNLGPNEVRAGLAALGVRG
jgi:CheY-like chemotaxis protein